MDGAEAWIIMPAHPQVGQRYRQESCPTAPSTTASGRRSLPGSSPASLEAKLYCPNVGFVKTRGLEGPPARLVLRHIF